MLELVIENTSIAPDDDTAIAITATNPALSKDNVGKVYSLPFKLAWTPQLLSLFKHARRLDARTKAQNLYAYIKLADFHLAKGIIKTNDENSKSSQKSLNLYFKKDNNAVLKKLEDFKIAEVCPKIVIPQPKFAGYKIKLKNSTVTPGNSYYLQVNDTQYQYTAASNQPIEVMFHFRDVINAQYPSVATVYNNQDTGNLELILTASTSFSPRLDKFGIIDFGGFQYITYASYAEATHDNFITFFRENLDTPREDISFNWITNNDFYQGKNPTFFFQWFNYAIKYPNDPDWQVATNTPSVSEEFERSFIPFYRFKYLMAQMLERIGLEDMEFDGDPDIWTDILTIVIDNNCALDNVRKDFFFTPTDAQGKEFFLNCHVNEINPSDHLPDMTAKTFLDAFANFFNFDYEVTDAKKLLFKKKNRIFSQPTQIIDTLIEGYERGYKNDNGFVLRYVKNETELLNDATLQPYQVGAGEVVIELPISTLHLDDSFAIVRTHRVGSTTAFSLGKKAFPLRFFFDKGIKEGLYWSSDNTADHISLDINHPTKGLYEIFWKNSAELEAAGYPLSIELMTSPQALHELLTFNQSKVYLMTDAGNVMAYIKEVSSKIRNPSGQLIRVKLELVVS